jgi:hypothetical protein
MDEPPPSTAQQAKRGHVYMISTVGSFGSDVYKHTVLNRRPNRQAGSAVDGPEPWQDQSATIPFSSQGPSPHESSGCCLWVSHNIGRVQPNSGSRASARKR